MSASNTFARRRKRANPFALTLLIVLIIIALFGIIITMVGYRYINAEGMKFSGFVRRDQPVSGTVKYENGISGHLKVDPETLIGTVVYDNGDIYEGNFKGIFRDGKGTLTYGDSAVVYKGDFLDDKLTGHARITSSGGMTYEGEMLDGEKSGYGTYSFPDGSYYAGMWERDMRNGTGVEHYADGAVYIGTFLNDQKHGSGMVSVPLEDGTVYNGKCRYAYANGDVYEGDYANDRKSGSGVYTYASGEKYEGEFADDTMNGHGTYTFTAGREPFTGTFVNGRLATEEEAALLAAENAENETGNNTDTENTDAGNAETPVA